MDKIKLNSVALCSGQIHSQGSLSTVIEFDLEDQSMPEFAAFMKELGSPEVFQITIERIPQSGSESAEDLDTGAGNGDENNEETIH